MFLLAVVISTVPIVASCANGGKTITEISINEKAPEFTLETIDGKKISLSDFAGKPVIIAFWELQCTACIKYVLPNLQKVYGKRKDQGLVVLAVNIQDAATFIRNSPQMPELTFPILLDRQKKVLSQYGDINDKTKLPITIFVSADGIYKKSTQEAFESPEKIEKILDSL
jgi:peroxiredoxin